MDGIRKDSTAISCGEYFYFALNSAIYRVKLDGTGFTQLYTEYELEIGPFTNDR